MRTSTAPRSRRQLLDDVRPPAPVTAARVATDYLRAQATPCTTTVLDFTLAFLAVADEAEFWLVSRAFAAATVRSEPEINTGHWSIPMKVPGYDTPVHLGQVCLDTRRRLDLPSEIDERAARDTATSKVSTRDQAAEAREHRNAIAAFNAQRASSR